MKIAAIAFSDQGMNLGARLRQALTTDQLELVRACPGQLAAWTAGQFQPGHALLFIGATGILSPGMTLIRGTGHRPDHPGPGREW